MKLFAFTLDLEADYAGVVGKYEIFKDLGKVEEFLKALQSQGVKITVFVVGEIFELYPDVIKLFEKYECEFEPHSYSHNFKYPDSEIEIDKAKKAYHRFFNKNPRGYRAPRGIISSEGINNLEKHGFLYDSSIFPSYFPNPFRYLLANRQAHYYGNSNILEIPLTSLTPLRLTLSISYIKLLGIQLYTKLQLPDIICFDSHLVDFIHNEKSFGELPSLWKFIYSRNKFRGLEYCVKLLKHVKQEGFEFCYMSEIYEKSRRKTS